MSESGARARALSASPQQRSFTDGRRTVIAELVPSGKWVLTYTTSMGVEHTKPFVSEQAMTEWLADNGYAEVHPAGRTRKGAKSAPALRLSESQAAYLATRISEWRRTTVDLYDGPDDPDFRLAFEANFGFAWSEWAARMEPSREPGVRKGVIAEAEAEIAAIVAAEAAAVVIDADAPERRRASATAGARRMSDVRAV